MIRIMILDDDEMYLKKEKDITEQYFAEKNVDCTVTTYQNVEWFLLGLNEEKFDMYILDIRMPGENGIEAAREIRRLYPDPVIIFITNFVDYAIEAYEVNTYRYIPKECLKEKLLQAYDALLPGIMEKEERYYIINKRNEVEKLAYSDIFYMKKIRASLSTVEKELNSKEFIISDRGYLANIQHVMKMKGRDLYMRDGNIITVGRERFKGVREAILNYWGV